MPTAFDDSIRPKTDEMLIEPIRPDKMISLVAGIIETYDRLPATIKATVIKFGELKRDPDFGPGAVIMISPHAGSLLVVPEGHPERMVIPCKHALMVYE